MTAMDDAVKNKIKVLVIELIICGLLTGFLVILNEFTITSIIVQGNEHYTSSQIKEIIENGWFGDNSLILSLKYRHKAFKNLPFVETMEVKIENRHSVRVIVYEKALAGYIRYLDRYMYFDKDGIIVENADVPTEGLPLVTGLEFDHITMFEPLPVGDKSVFQTILDVTKILAKHDMSADKIYFNEKLEMTLYFGEMRIMLGSSDMLEEKLQQVEAIMASLKGKEYSGVLDLSTYDSNTSQFSFQIDE